LHAFHRAAIGSSKRSYYEGSSVVALFTGPDLS